MTRRRRVVMVGALLCITIVALLACRARLAALTGGATLLPRNDPYVRLDREITAEFGTTDPVVWVLEVRSGTIWTPAMLRRLQALTKAVLTIPGVVATDVISLASPNVRDVEATDEGLAPIYLMPVVPETPDAIAALRRRVESNPDYRGILVSNGGRAAMVVAGFRPDADQLAVGRAALALRDRYGDADAVVHVVGAPVLRASLPGISRPLAWYVAVAGVATLVIFGVVLGPQTASAVLLAAVLACAWTVLAAVATGAATLPWAADALPLVFLTAALLAAGGGTSVAAQLAGCLVLGGAGLALWLDAPMRSFAVCAAFGGLSALAAALVVRWLIGAAPSPSRLRWVWPAAAVAVLALAGLPRLTTSFGLLGYGRHYLPGQGAADIAALQRFFAPPTTLAIRVRGAPGFVAEPAVLEAFDGVAAAVRRDPSVSRVMTLADLVKFVNRAFHGNREAFATIPDSRRLVARYLALSYSPGFARFVDRALRQSALWIYLRSDRPADIARVLALVRRQLASEPVPDAQVDLAGGDGAVILVMARMATRLTEGAALLVLVVALGASVLRGRTVLWRSLLGGITGAAVMAGGLGWLGLPVDLVTLPCVAIAAGFGALAGAGDRAAPSERLALALAVSGAVGLALPLAVLELLGLLLVACGVAGTVAQAGVLAPREVAPCGSRSAGDRRARAADPLGA